MPFPFQLPTTSTVLLSEYFESATHPSLPFAATAKRSILKDALKKYKRLPPREKAIHLSTVLDAVKAYIPYLLAIRAASALANVGNERIDLSVKRPLEAEWRITLSSTLPGREPPRPKLIGLHYEVAFTLSTLAYVHSLLARSQLRLIYESNVLSVEQRAGAITAAMKHLLEAHNIHIYTRSLPSLAAATDAPIDISSSTVSGLASLALAEATLLFVAKDDPYAAAVLDDRNENNKDWMYKAPSIPKVRAHLFARICLAAADHARQAEGLLTTGKIDGDLVRYATDLRRTAKGKAARFLGIDADLAGKTGEALAWLKAARKELGLNIELDEGKRKGLKGLKHSWQEKREDKKVEKGGEWGRDAGKLEEARAVEMLETKWDRENSTVNVQVVPAFEPLLVNMPTGRECHSPQAWQPPVLEASVLAEIRAPPEPREVFGGEEEDSGGEDGMYTGAKSDALGAYPGTEEHYARSGTSSSYY